MRNLALLSILALTLTACGIGADRGQAPKENSDAQMSADASSNVVKYDNVILVKFHHDG